jgi:pimeloyl-ACP methyl ester carboxylesterase
MPAIRMSSLIDKGAGALESTIHPSTIAPFQAQCAPSAALPSIQPRQTLIDGHRMYALAAGSGEPLVLLHGLLGTAAGWLPSMTLLARHAQVFAVDALGIGNSDRVPGLDASLEASARRLARWMDSQSLPVVDLLGTSHGGAVALCFAGLFPDRVRSLTLHAPANPFCVQSRPQIRFAGTLPGRLLASWLPVAPAMLQRIALSRMYGDPARLRPGSLEEYVTSLRVPGTVDYVLSILHSWIPDMTALAPMLPRMRRLPIQLLWGAQDRAVSIASAMRLRAVLRAPLEVMPGLGHLPFEEDPETFAERVLAFLTSCREGRHPAASLRTA